jgi:hypothetical protein
VTNAFLLAGDGEENKRFEDEKISVNQAAPVSPAS